MTADDVRMVIERLGLQVEDADEVRQAFADIDRLGQDGFEDLVLRENAAALIVAHAEQGIPEPEKRRAIVRAAVAIKLREFTELRDLQGPAH
jgi:hypothetical protein